VDFSANRTVLFSTHVIEDLSATCNQLAILKKGRIIFDGGIRELMHYAKDNVWLCRTDTAEQLERIQGSYLIASRQYRDQRMELKVISKERPPVPCEQAEVTLEDAYIYVHNNS
jgi:ABC-type multidrug transport system ATPase subunit